MVHTSSPLFPLLYVHFSVPPTLTLVPSAVRDVVRGEILVASCRANADPPAMIQWFRGGQQLGAQNQSLEGVSIIPQSIDDITTSSRLTVTGFTSDEAGVYSCVAVNALGNDSSTFQVNVVGEFEPRVWICIIHIYICRAICNVRRSILRHKAPSGNCYTDTTDSITPCTIHCAG